MKIIGKNLLSEEVITQATEMNGCYGEYTYSKQLHDDLINDGAKHQFNKILNQHEYWKDIDKDNTLYRIHLK
jgi:hypothetical protein